MIRLMKIGGWTELSWAELVGLWLWAMGDYRWWCRMWWWWHLSMQHLSQKPLNFWKLSNWWLAVPPFVLVLKEWQQWWNSFWHLADFIHIASLLKFCNFAVLHFHFHFPDHDNNFQSLYTWSINLKQQSFKILSHKIDLLGVVDRSGGGKQKKKDFVQDHHVCLLIIQWEEITSIYVRNDLLPIFFVAKIW